MAKITRMGLFVTRFVAFNLDRYDTDPVMKPLFVGLTESELVFEDMVLAVKGARSTTIKSKSRNFVGYNQRWTAAEINDIDAFVMTDYEATENLAEVLTKNVPGIYAYMDADGVTLKIIVLVPRSTVLGDRPTVAKAMLIEALRFDILNKDITAYEDKITFNAPCMWGDVKFDIAADTIVHVTGKEYGQLTYPEDLVID